MDSGVRKNTLKICFGAEAKVPAHVEVLGFVIGTLKLGAADLHSVYKDENDGHFYIKLMDEPTFTEYCGRLEEMYPFTYDDGTRNPCTLEVASRIFRYVRIFNLPPEVEDKEIGQVLGTFGTIRQFVRERYPPSYKLPIYNGVRGVHMEIAKEIPASLFIKHFRARIFYDGLKNRCFYCKEEGHLKSSCPKLVASSSGSGGSRSYSGVTAQGRPASGALTPRERAAAAANRPILNVPNLELNMQQLEKSPPGPTASPVTIPITEVITEQPKSDPVVHDGKVDPVEPATAVPGAPAANATMAGPSTSPEQRAAILEATISQHIDDISDVEDTEDSDGVKGVKRLADISPISSASEDVEMDNIQQSEVKQGDFQKAKGKRNKKDKKNQQKPLKTIATRSLMKALK